MDRVLEAVPNFSEGRDAGFVRTVVEAMQHAGATVLDWTADAEHHRSVVTIAGPPAAVEDAVVAAAGLAVRNIDLRRHVGVHPRIGALDVLPFVPLVGLTMEDARQSALRTADRLAREVGIPVYLYGHASDPPGRRLGELRRGGYERLVGGWPDDRQPDFQPPRWPHDGAHPTAGVTCVGARNVLLAWNVYVDGLKLDEVRSIAGDLRETRGGPRGVRALGLYLASRDEYQISMNLEDAETAAPMDVFRLIETAVSAAGGRVTRTEVIGMVPDRLLADAAADRLRLDEQATDRQLSRRLIELLAG